MACCTFARVTRVTVEVLEGSRPVREVQIAALTNQYVGVSAYMDLDALNRMMREGRAISGAYLAADSRYEPAIYALLKDAPRVAGVTSNKKKLKSLEETMAEQVLTFAFFITLFAGTIAFGVVYNSARIALSERSRELASLRVLGLTRGEISFILLGELAVLTLAAIPVGFLLGWVLCGYIVRSPRDRPVSNPIRRRARYIRVCRDGGVGLGLHIRTAGAAEAGIILISSRF